MRKIITLADLVARPLDLVKTKWAQMLQFIKTRDVVIADPDALVRIDLKGTRVSYRAKGSLPSPFRVSLSERTVRVRAGYVDDQMPTIGGIRLDGRDAEGKQQSLPTYELPEDAAPGEDGRSFICLVMRYDPEKKQADSAEPDWLTIGHVANLATARREAGGKIAYEPLAEVYWVDEQPASTSQIVTLDLKHVFVPGDPGRHFFAGV